MNIYLYDENFNPESDNVMMSDELLDFIYQNRDSFDISMHFLLEIDRYSDTILYPDEIKQLERLCSFCISNLTVFDSYHFEKNWDFSPKYTFMKLHKYCQLAQQNGSSLICMGD